MKASTTPPPIWKEANSKPEARPDLTFADFAQCCDLYGGIGHGITYAERDLRQRGEQYRVDMAETEDPDDISKS